MPIMGGPKSFGQPVAKVQTDAWRVKPFRMELQKRSFVATGFR